MKKQPIQALPLMLTQLAMASWITIMQRGAMMAGGTCTLAEYQRMGMEKAAAMQGSMLAMIAGRGPAAAVAPYVTRARARANARRLSRKS